MTTRDAMPHSELPTEQIINLCGVPTQQNTYEAARTTYGCLLRCGSRAAASQRIYTDSGARDRIFEIIFNGKFFLEIKLNPAFTARWREPSSVNLQAGNKNYYIRLELT
uniref:Galectin n=1 Tax=Trichogramma kaykai TaxID=54128 RepID=A0ABD2VWU1_9HYME